MYACPKFISANSPPYHSIPLLATYVQNMPIEPAAHHLALFMKDVSIRVGNRDLRSYLKLYTSLDAKKLASYLDGSAVAKNGKVDEESDPEAEADGGEAEGEEKM